MSLNHRKTAPLILLILLFCVAGERAATQENRENSDFKLAVGLYNDGLYDLAVEQLKNFVSAYPASSQSIEARFYLGSAQMKLKRYEDARQTFQNFALTYTDHAKAAEAWKMVGDAYAGLKNGQEAASSYERLKVFHPKSPLVPEALLSAAEQYRELGSAGSPGSPGFIESAKRVLRSIIQDYPTSSSALPSRVMLSEIYLDEGNTDLAEKEAAKVVRSDAPAAVRAASLLVIGKLQEQNCLYDEADASFSSILKEFPTAPSAGAATLELGILDSREEQFDSAVKKLTDVAGNERIEDSLRARALLELGVTYERQKDLPNAQSSYEKLLTKFPRSVLVGNAALAAGRTALKRKRYSDAVRIAEQLTSAPASPLRREGFVLAAEASAGRKEFGDAAEKYSKFIAAFPNDPFEPEIMLRLGDLYAGNLGEYRNAIAVYDDFRRKFPRHEEIAQVTYNINLCQVALNDVNGAITTCKELQQRFPAFEEDGAIEARIDSLTSNTAANRDQSVRELSSMLGQLLHEESKAEIAFRLGKFYFHTLRDYRSAAEQFTFAIDGGVSKDDFTEAYFLRARSYHLLLPADSAREKAILYYDSFLKLYPESRWTDDAAYYSFILGSGRKSGKPDPSAIAAFIETHPNSTHNRELYLELGARAFAGNDYRKAIDYLAKNTAPPKFVPGDRKELGVVTSSYLLAGKSFIALHRLDSASILLKRLKQLPGVDANLPRAEAELADAYRLSQSYDSSAVLVRRLTSEFFYTPPAQIAAEHGGELAIATGKFEEGARFYADRLEWEQSSPFPEDRNPETAYDLANACARAGDAGKAKYYFLTYLRENPQGIHSAHAYSALGIMARTSGNADRASAYLKKASSLGVADSTQAYLLADQLFQTGQYQEAAKQYRQLSQTTSSGAAKQRYLSAAIVSSYRADDLSGGDKMFAANKDLFAKDKSAIAEVTYEKGCLQYRQKDYVAAKKLFDVVADDYEETRFGPWGHYYLGKILEVSDKLKEAAKGYDEVIEQFPKSDVLPRVYLSLGNMHFNAERFEDAIRFFRRALETADSSNEVVPFALNNLIEAYESTKLYDAAIKTTRLYIDRYPGDELIMDKRIKLGSLLTKAGYYDQAIAQFQQLLNEGESALEAELRYNIGEAYYYKGDYQQAILEFLKVPYLVTKRGKIDWIATSYYMAGQSYEKISKFDEAMNMYKQIVDRPGIDPTFKAGARKEIDRVKQLTKKGSQ